MRVKVMHRKAANGFYIGREVVPACPKTGAWLTPPDCVDAPPPVTIPAGYWPRWGGNGWRLARLPWRVRAGAWCGRQWLFVRARLMSTLQCRY